MTALIAPILVAVFATTVEARGQLLLQTDRGPGYGTYGMPPCKHCGSNLVHSRDQLLDTDDGKLLKMKDDLSKEVETLEGDVADLKEKNGKELGKLNKRLSDMDTAYKKFGKDTIARTAKFSEKKAKASKEFDGSLESTGNMHTDIAEMRVEMAELRKIAAPYVDKFISGKGWPHGCKCPKAKSLLQHLQATLRLASLDVDDDTDDTSTPKSALLRRSAKTSKPQDQEKYKLVREVQQLEEKRAKLMAEKTSAITGFGEQQRRSLDRIDTAKIKSNLKATTERKYKDFDDTIDKSLKTQNSAAVKYLDSAKTRLARITKNVGAARKNFNDFKAELQRCKCV